MLKEESDTTMNDSPAAIAALTAMRELLILLRMKGLITAGEILDMLNKVDPGISAEDPFDKMTYRAYLWLKTPHLIDGALETIENIKRQDQPDI